MKGSIGINPSNLATTNWVVDPTGHTILLVLNMYSFSSIQNIYLDILSKELDKDRRNRVLLERIEMLTKGKTIEQSTNILTYEVFRFTKYPIEIGKWKEGITKAGRKKIDIFPVFRDEKPEVNLLTITLTSGWIDKEEYDNKFIPLIEKSYYRGDDGNFVRAKYKGFSIMFHKEKDPQKMNKNGPWVEIHLWSKQVPRCKRTGRPIFTTMLNE